VAKEATQVIFSAQDKNQTNAKAIKLGQSKNFLKPILMKVGRLDKVITYSVSIIVMIFVCVSLAAS
jgi:hypothetical protein